MADEVHISPLTGGLPVSNKPNFKMNDGDWLCEDEKCGNVNFARRRSCNRCGKDKSTTKAKDGIEIGKNAAEKSRGLFSANDWQCKTCGNVNWARRNECNMCHTPKVGKIEERTGYGGGYNERGIVEYVAREDSDSEFDEFGRRKKGYRKSTSVSDDTTKVSSTNAAEEEEEDSGDDADLSNYKLDSEEESGDDEDLSKYKLDSDSDDEGKLSKNDAASDDENNKKDRRHSYSRSLSSRSRSHSSSRSRSRSRSRSSSQTSFSSTGSSSRSRSRSRSSSYDSRSRSRRKRPSEHSGSRSSSGGSWKRRKHHDSRDRSGSRSSSQERFGTKDRKIQK